MRRIRSCDERHQKAADIVHRSQSVLIVESQALLRWSLETYLTKWFEVFTAESEEEARHLLDERPMDILIVSDELSPEKMLAVEHRARQRNGEARIIAMVATAEDRTDCYIEKPFDLSSLAKLLGVDD